MSLTALAAYTFKSRYAKYNPEKRRRETWGEITERVFDMHAEKFKDLIDTNEEFRKMFEFSKQMVKDKKVLGSQRSLQFAGEPIKRHNSKLYNCSATNIDRPDVFKEILYLLLSGCGVGFSVQKRHVSSLPFIGPKNKNVSSTKVVHIGDSIEGWAEAVDELMDFYFVTGNNYNSFAKIEFDYSLIRPKGAKITGGFKAPGPEPLKRSIEIISNILDKITEEGGRQLRPIEVYDIIMHLADAVISGGVRRSACITLFDYDDEEMLKSKSEPFWWENNPQRTRSNNSVVFNRKEVTREQFDTVTQYVKNFGEPGFVFVDNYDVCVNPCCEISMLPITYDKDGNKTGSGFAFCNLTEIVGAKCKTEEDFLNACKAASFIGTMQAAYTDFKFLSPKTKEITERDALIGVSITGYMDSPEILFDEKIQQKGAKTVKDTNIKFAKIIGINPAKRCNTTKPAGTSSIITQTASGIHPHFSKRYIRRVQSGKDEFCLNYFAKFNPHAIEQTVIGSRDNNISAILFPCEVPSGSIVKNQLPAIEFLKKIKSTQENWIASGTNKEACEKFEKDITHNISNTITVKPDEWEEVFDFIFENRSNFCGISLLAQSGDLDYKQAPFTTIHTPAEIVKEYGDGSVMASGVIVAGLEAYNDDLWDACNAVIYNKEEELKERVHEIEGMNCEKVSYDVLKKEYDELCVKIKWINQAKRFADKYINGDYRRMTYLLKDVNNWKTYCDLKRDWVQVPWNDAIEEVEAEIDVDTTGASACAGGKCELHF